MMTEQSYQMAWLIYSLAAVGILVSLRFGFFYRADAPLRWSLLLLCAVIMLFPAHPDASVESWAPAIVVSGFDLLTHGPDAAAVSARPLLILGLAVLLPGLGWSLLRRVRGVKKS
jgi:hypothetical protein